MYGTGRCINRGLTVYAIVNFPGNCGAATIGIFRAGSTVGGNTSRVSVIVGVNTLETKVSSCVVGRVGRVGSTYNSGLLGIVVRTYLLARSRGLHVYEGIALTNTSCVGASANFSATNTAHTSITLVGTGINSNMEIGTTNKVSSLGSTRTFVGLNTSQLNADHIIGTIRKVGNDKCWSGLGKEGRCICACPSCEDWGEQFYGGDLGTKQPTSFGVCYQGLPRQYYTYWRYPQYSKLCQLLRKRGNINCNVQCKATHGQCLFL